MSTQVPGPVLSAVQASLRDLWGASAQIEEATSVPGGSINRAARLRIAGHAALFLKWNPGGPRHMLAGEADGLRALGEVPDGPRIPEVISHGVAEGTRLTPWLAMEWIAAGNPGPDFGERLADDLAAVHGHGAAGRPEFGWPSDNHIGPLPQSNRPTAQWAEFWVECRLGPQLRRAFRSGALSDDGSWQEALHVCDRLLTERAATPDLLHGDLWRGNVFGDAEGRPTLVDPAVYRGDGFVDLVMAELFGGFPDRFFECYAAARRRVGIDPPADAIRAAYRLYPLLVHLNLFGSGYRSACERERDRIVQGA